MASWGSAEDSGCVLLLAVCFPTDIVCLLPVVRPAGVPEFGVPSAGAHAGVGSVPACWTRVWLPSLGVVAPGLCRLLRVLLPVQLLLPDWLVAFLRLRVWCWVLLAFEVLRPRGGSMRGSFYRA